MRESDLPEILAIEKNSFSAPWSRCAFENEMRAAYAFPMVMTQQDPSQVLGYLCFWLVTDECHILTLAVHPAHRRKRIATGLVQNLLDVCGQHRISHCYLEVRVSNRIAISLYEKCGFSSHDIRKKYYPDTGEDAMVMRRRISCQ